MLPAARPAAAAGLPVSALIGVRHALEEFFFPLLIGLDPLDLEALHERLDRRLQGHSFAKAAIDFACYDLAGKPLINLIDKKLMY